MMRLIAALFLGLVGALVGASGVASADPPNDFATGAGKIERTLGPPTSPTQIEEKFAFSAHDEDAIGGATSPARNGHFVYERTFTSPTGSSTTLEVKGSISCVWVEGNQASFNGLVEKSNDPTLEGVFARFRVVDNDQPPVNGAAPDQLAQVGFTRNPSCLFPSSVPPSANIISGNILVNDAQQMA
jgi:hypothetical protein